MGLEIVQSLSTKKQDTGFVTVTISTSQHLVISNNHLKVVQPGRFSSRRFAFDRQSLSFCILWCITRFTIAPCTVPVFNYHFKQLKVFGGYGKLFQILDPKTLKLLLPHVTWLCTGIFNLTYIFLEQSHKMVEHTQTICLSVFYHFVKLVLKGLNYRGLS